MHNDWNSYKASWRKSRLNGVSARFAKFPLPCQTPHSLLFFITSFETTIVLLSCDEWVAGGQKDKRSLVSSKLSNKSYFGRPQKVDLINILFWKTVNPLRNDNWRPDADGDYLASFKTLSLISQFHLLFIPMFCLEMDLAAE